MTPSLLVALFGILLAVLPAIIEWRLAKRNRHLAEARLLIAEVTTRMQKHLLAGNIKRGQLCHDKVFPLMERVQNIPHCDGYSLCWMWPKAPSEESRVFAMKLSEEKRSLPSEVERDLGLFVSGLTRACRFRHPFRFWSMALCLGAALVFLRVLLQTKMVLQAWDKARDEIRKVVLAQTYDEFQNQPALNGKLAFN